MFRKGGFDSSKIRFGIFVLALVFLVGLLFAGCDLLGETTYFLDVGVNKEEAGSVHKDPDLEEYTEGTIVKLTAVPNDGWMFSEWQGDMEGTEKTIQIEMDENKDITAVFEREEYALNEEWRYLYEGEHRRATEEAIGLSDGGNWQAAFILVPETQDEYITKVAFYDFDSFSTITPKIYRDTEREPSEQLWVGDEYESTGAGWVEIAVTPKVAIEEGESYWILFEVSQPEGMYPIGVDYGPPQDNADKINIAGEWERLTDYGLDYNWLMECLVEYANVEETTYVLDVGVNKGEAGSVHKDPDLEE